MDVRDRAGFGENAAPRRLSPRPAPLAWWGAGKPRSRVPGVWWAIISAYLIFHAVVGGAVLARYLLPALALFYIALAEWLIRLPKPGLWAAGCAAWLVAGWFWNPPYPFPYEDNLAYAQFVRLHQAAARELESLPLPGPIYTAWPATDELTRPELGYVTRPLPVQRLPDFTPDTLTHLGDPPPAAGPELPRQHGARSQGQTSEIRNGAPLPGSDSAEGARSKRREAAAGADRAGACGAPGPVERQAGRVAKPLGVPRQSTDGEGAYTDVRDRAEYGEPRRNAAARLLSPRPAPRLLYLYSRDYQPGDDWARWPLWQRWAQRYFAYTPAAPPSAWEARTGLQVTFRRAAAGQWVKIATVGPGGG